MSSEIPFSLEAEAFLCSRTQHEQDRYARYCHSAGVEEHITRERIASEAGRSRVWPSTDDAGGPHREGEEPKPMMHGRGKSDEAVVAVKPANKAERSAAELVEPRAEAKGNAGQQCTCRAQNRISVSPALVSIRQAFAVRPEVGAVCGKAARTDLCGGREVTRVPTATAPEIYQRGTTVDAPLPTRNTKAAACGPFNAWANAPQSPTKIQPPRLARLPTLQADEVIE